MADPASAGRARIVAITPNPAIDKTVVVPDYRLGQIHRPEQLIVLPGGKGLNVARSIARLGHDAGAAVLLAGHSGRWIAEQLRHNGIRTYASWAKGETRSCLSVLDPSSGAITELYESGSPVTAAQWRGLERCIDRALATAGLATCSGSLPPGAPPDAYARLIRLAAQHDVSLLIDTHGAALAAALAARPALVKINAAEAGACVGTVVDSLERASATAEQLLARGAGQVVISLGAHGAVGVDGYGAWHAAPPPIELVSAVGSGDALLAGFAVATLRGAAFAEALRYGVAVASANACCLGGGVFDIALADALLERVELRRMR